MLVILALVAYTVVAVLVITWATTPRRNGRRVR